MLYHSTIEVAIVYLLACQSRSRSRMIPMIRLPDGEVSFNPNAYDYISDSF
jgi:hypothetical protein